jgi:hypothetical protein
MCCDLLWDGEEWVQHEGVVHTGRKKVTTYQGLSATDNHEVWTVEKGKVSFGEARTQRLELVRPVYEGKETYSAKSDSFPQVRGEGREGAFLRTRQMHQVWERDANGVEQLGEGQKHEMPVPGSIALGRSFSGRGNRRAKISGKPVFRHEAKMRKKYARLESPLSRARDQGEVPFSAGVHMLGSEKVARRVFQRKGFRPEEQRRGLHQEQFTTGRPYYESAESSMHARGEHCGGTQGEEEASTLTLHGADCSRTAAVRYEGVGHCCKRDDKPISWETEVYDIVNAGPRHRYVCSGVLVSNSSMYGATPATLERKIEADTGVAPEPGVGDRTLKALEDRQPSATAFLKGLEEAPESPGWLRAASGKVRHFQLPKCSAGVPWKLFKSQKSAQGREARNFFMQESVAATAMRAANWLLAFKMRYGLSGVPMTVLYDSVCTLTENRERYVWAKAHEICMHLANGWEYHGRVLRYPIDTDLNSGWSLGPDKDPRYKGREKIFSDSSNERDPALEPMEKWLDSLIDYFKQYERASLNFSGLAS